MKKLIIIAILITITLCITNNKVTAEEQSGDFIYRVTNSEATILKYSGSSSELIIPDKLGGYPVVRIGSTAFKSNINITKVTLPNKLKVIGNEAFVDCINLYYVSMPDSVTEIEPGGFIGCTKLTEINLSSSLTGIGLFSFKNCSSLENIEIPEGVIELEHEVFMNCSKLRTIKLSSKTKRIDVRALSGTGIETISIPAATTSIAFEVFKSCQNLKEIKVDPENPNYTTVNSMLLFKNMTQILKCPEAIEGVVTIPASVKYIQSTAVSHLKNATKLEVEPGNISYVAIDNVLYDINETTLIHALCKKTSSFEIPNTVTTIIEGAFWDCKSLTEIKISNSVKEIGNNAFKGCDSLTSVIIPDSVESIGEGLFADCISLKTVILGNNIKGIPTETFFNCRSLTTAEIPEGLYSIGERAFKDCKKLNITELPNQLIGIGKEAFLNCVSLTKVIFPWQRVSFGDRAFYGCTNLKETYFMSNAPEQFGKEVFDKCAPSFKIYYDSSRYYWTKDFHGYTALSDNGSPDNTPTTKPSQTDSVGYTPTPTDSVSYTPTPTDSVSYSPTPTDSVSTSSPSPSPTDSVGYTIEVGNTTNKESNNSIKTVTIILTGICVLGILSMGAIVIKNKVK